MKSLRCVDWTTMATTAACDIRFERFGLPMLCRLRHDAASHEVFNPFWTCESSFSKSQCFRRLLAYHSCSDDQRSIAEHWFSRCRPLRNGVRTATEETIFLSGSGAALVARPRKRTRAWKALTCLAFGRQSPVYQTLT